VKKYKITQPDKKPRFYLITKIKAKKPSWGQKAKILGKKPSSGNIDTNPPSLAVPVNCGLGPPWGKND
jgi:hypothetical protein